MNQRNLCFLSFGDLSLWLLFVGGMVQKHVSWLENVRLLWWYVGYAVGVIEGAGPMICNIHGKLAKQFTFWSLDLAQAIGLWLLAPWSGDLHLVGDALVVWFDCRIGAQALVRHVAMVVEALTDGLPTCFRIFLVAPSSLSANNDIGWSSSCIMGNNWDMELNRFKWKSKTHKVNPK